LAKPPHPTPLRNPALTNDYEAQSKLQTTYPSWMAMSDDFLLGVRYLAGGEPAERGVAHSDQSRRDPNTLRKPCAAP